MMQQKFRWTGYFGILSKIVKDPKSFYRENANETSVVNPIFVLVISGLVFTIASAVMAMPNSTVLMILILFVNAVGMVLVTSGLGFMVMMITQKNKVPYRKILSIYAYASGAVLIIAWMPFMLWIAEIWRWWLIGNGLMAGCGYKLKESLIIIFLSLFILILFFWTLVPFLNP